MPQDDRPSLERLPADDRIIAKALEDAQIPSLAAALVHLTGDLSHIETGPVPEANLLGDKQCNLPLTYQAEIRAKMLAALQRWRAQGSPALAPLPPETVTRIMSWIAGASVPEPYLPMLADELAMDREAARDAPHEINAADQAKRRFHVVIIGAGMSGLLTAIQLKRAGIAFTIVEKNPEVGGTWYENTYPGCRVDNPNHMYSYSFDTNPDWPQFYSTQAILLDYFRRSANAHDLRAQIRFDTRVEAAEFDEAAGQWHVHVASGDGKRETLIGSALVSAVGQLNHPKFPDLKGRERFKGLSFHSSRWPANADLAGKRVAIIGTGASANQFIPEIADKVADLTIFQRTPPWLIPTPDYHHDVPEGQKWLLKHVPFYGKWFRFWLFWTMTDGLLAAVKGDADWPDKSLAIGAANQEARTMLTAYIAAQVDNDTELLNKLVPNYPVGGKRMLRDNGLYIQTLRRANAHLVTDPIEEILESGVRLKSGTLVEADVLIYGTGFTASDFLAEMRIVGRNGVALHDQWDGDARAYLGVTVPNFPNFFIIYGPNTNIVVNGSIIFFSECAVRYVLGCVKTLLESGAKSIEIRKDVHDRFNGLVDAENEKMAWGAPGVSSWYKNAKGRVTQNWPFPLVDYWERTRAPKLDEFILSR